jgi:Ca-activated chloride channel family protein
MLRVRSCSLFVAAILAGGLIGAHAGEPPSSSRVDADAEPAGEFEFHVTSDEVLLYATVVGSVPAVELSREHFRIFDNGEPQVIRSFRHERGPLSLGILIDSSDSMLKQRGAVRAAARELISSCDELDEGFLARFAYDYALAREFTSDRRALAAALDEIKPRGGTALYDAVAESAAYLTRRGRHQQRVLVVFTDGVDVHSRLSLEDTLRRLKTDGAPVVYVIAMLGEDDDGRRARLELPRLAAETGGRAVFPRSDAELRERAQALARELRPQYVMTYRPEGRGPRAGYHAITVEAAAGGTGRLEVRTRAGYVAGPR